ncbi:MAG: hypothetical protein ABI746_09525 [Dermatophilaceae bacterium]
MPVHEAVLEPGAAPSRGERVGAALRRWRGELAQTGGPNALLWYRDSPGGTLDLTGAHPTGVSMLIAGNRVRLSNMVREEGAFAEARRTARRIREKALELREQHGLDAGYLVIGTASWELPGTHRRPHAPIMLRTCHLHAVDAAESDLELELSPHVEINPVLVHYMAAERGIRIDGDALADLAHATGRFDPLPVYRELTRQLVHVPGFHVTDRRVMSTFATTKMAMVADLAGFANLLAGHDIIAAFAGDPTAAQSLADDGAGGLADSRRRPVEPDLGRERLVLDADPSQTEVIDAARSGRHVLVDAAPGTGATQTLANVAAALVGTDQRVLVVSENSRQLDAFVEHMDAAGLRGLILDGRDPAELRRTLPGDIIARLETDEPTPYGMSGQPPSPDGGLATAVAHTRGQLAAHRDSVHAPRQPWGVSVFEAQTALARLSGQQDPPTSGVRIPPDRLREMTLDGLRSLADVAADAARSGAWSTDHDDDDPWWGAHLTTAKEVLRALGLATDAAERRLADDRAALDAALADVGLPPARTAQDWGSALRLISEVRDTLAVFRPEVFAQPLDALVAATAAGGQRDGDASPSWWARRDRKKQARALVLPHARVESVHDGLRRAVTQRAAWDDLAGHDAAPGVPEGLDEAQSRYAKLVEDLGWLDDALGGTRAGGGLLELPLDALAERLAVLASRHDGIAVFPALAPVLTDLRQAGLGELLDDLAIRHVAADHVADEAEFAWWLSVLDAVAAQDPTYGRHDGAILRGLLRQYADEDAALLEGHARAIADRARAHARVEAAARPDQVNLLRDALEERHPRPVRELLAQCGDVVAAAAPIWVLSPLALATVVPTHLTFDAVLIDDAARMPVVHAVSALARAVRVVAMGDLQGMGPAPFETVAGIPDQGAAPLVAAPPVAAPLVAGLVDARPRRDDGAAHLTSVLEALAAHLPLRHLTRVYADRDARIASFALERREERVATLPHAGRGPALRMVRTGAILSSADDGASASAREATRVVQLVLEHARRCGDRSLAVVTFGDGEAARLDAAIRKALRDAPESASAPTFADGASERLLVTSLDRAAGYSRDTVILATGVLPRIEQAPSSGDAGGPGRRGTIGIVESVAVPPRLRRPDGALLVDSTVSLARRRLDIVSAVTAADLARVEDSTPGEDRLVELLDHADRAHRHSLATAPRTDDRHALLGELASRLRHEGLTVHEGYGLGDERVDLAVEDPYLPGQLIVAVGSDGGRHASLATVRERDRLIPQLLARRGWRYVRVWSTDVFRDPARDVVRVLDAVRGEDRTDEVHATMQGTDAAGDNQIGDDLTGTDPARDDAAGDDVGDGSGTSSARHPLVADAGTGRAD